MSPRVVHFNSIYFLLHIFKLIHAQQNPTISHISGDKVVNVGDTIDLQCSVQYAYNYPIIWAKVNRDNPSSNLLISQLSSLSIPDNRFSIRHDEASSTYTLQISKIQASDAGTYQCQVVLAATSSVSADVNVVVHVPPVISDNSTRRVVTSIGVTSMLQCYATGVPRPEISWKRENDDVLPTGGIVYKGNILTIYNISKFDRGTYYCIAENGVGHKAQRYVRVEVEFPPQITTSKEMYYQAVGYPVDIDCITEGFPSPELTWSKDMYAIADRENNYIITKSADLENAESRLRIQVVQKNDYGEYVCRAHNKLGTVEKVFRLLQTEVPVCPPACGVGGAALLRPLNEALAAVVFGAFLLWRIRQC